ncbi:MAG: ABC transporter permease subunit [Candidatus Altiarchaeales archaeon]|nr:ABC transporter permease subunit [Candidatus Altiarchaeales archaeon]
MLRTFVIAKKEIKEYGSSYIELASITAIVFGSLFLLLSPEFASTENPAAYDIYSLGISEGVDVRDVDSFTVKTRRITQKQAKSLLDSGLIDGWVKQDEGTLFFYAADTSRGQALKQEMREWFKKLNDERIYTASVNQSLERLLFPVRVRYVERNISYSYEGRLGGGDTPQKGGNTGEGDIEGGLSEVLQEQYIKAGSGESDSETFVFPDDLEETFPFKSLYQNIGFLATSMLISILAALSFMRERVKGTLINLFQAPLSSASILFGKTLPYFLIISLFNLFFGFLLSFGFKAVLIGTVFNVISLSFISIALAVMCASRSYRELTFNLSFFLLVFFFYMVVPNVFSGINPLAAVSPLEMVVRIQHDAPVSAGELFYSLIPYVLFTASLFAFTLINFTAETIISPKKVARLIRDYVDGLFDKIKITLVFPAVFVFSAVPFIYIIQNMLSFSLFPLSPFMGELRYLVLIMLAFLEELIKIIPYLKVRGKINPLVYAFSAGGSFFVAEKLFNIYLISNVYSLLPSPWTLLVTKGLVYTFFLHIITVLAAVGVLSFLGKRDLNRYSLIIAVISATTIHTGYNLFIYSWARGLLL